MRINKTFKDQWARRLNENALMVMNHLNIGSITKFGASIGADSGTICRWVNHKDQQGWQPAYFLAAIFERYGSGMVLAMFTGRVEEPRGIENMIDQMNIDQTLDLMAKAQNRLAILVGSRDTGEN